MSSLRLFGLLVGISGLLITFIRYRGSKWRRSNFVLFSILSLCIITASVDPNSINFVRDSLSLTQYLYGRLLALLIVSNVFLLFYTAYSKSKQETLWFQFDKLVRRLGALDLGKNRELPSKLQSIMVLIPAYNEVENLEDLIPRIPKAIKGMPVGILVVDDGSQDGTAAVVRKSNNLVVSNLVNRGGGAALRLGYDILQQASGYICVTMDADGQHQPEEIEKLLLPIINNEYDFVIGSRILGSREKDSLFRLIDVHLFGYIVSLLIGRRITDPSSNFRAF